MTRRPRWQVTWQEWGSEWTRLAGNLLIDWSVGSLLVGIVLAVAAFVIARALLGYVAIAPSPAAAAAVTPRD